MVLRRRTRWSAVNTASRKILFPNRLRVLTLVIGIIFSLIAFRLFDLQVIRGAYFKGKIQAQSSSEQDLLARRGDILVRDPKTGDLVPLALNTSLDELRIDAQEIPDPKLAADILAPLIFGQEEYTECQNDPTTCPGAPAPLSEVPVTTVSETSEIPAVPALLPVLTFEQAIASKKEEIISKLQTKNRYILLKRQLTPEISAQIKNLKKKYADAHQKDRARLYSSKKNVDDAVPDYLKGVILVSKSLRYYPEKELAAAVVGFVNHDMSGQYGIEGKENTLLAGEKGLFSGQTNSFGGYVDLSVENFQKAIDGSDIVLTLDRIVQKKAEEIMADAVQKFKADSGQVLVMDPKTGAVIAMVNYPTFDPNQYGNIYLTRRTTPNDTVHIFKTTPLFKKDPTDPLGKKLIPATYDEYEEAWKAGFDPEFYIYENYVGPEAYANKTIQRIYEPGSVFKPVVMSIALNDGEVTPSTQYNEEKPVDVDVGGRLVSIHNADKLYKGWQTMTNVLERSANLGMVFVARQLGKGVMYENLKNFGFGKETDIDLDEELPGMLSYYTNWSTAQLFNIAFGQGISVTPLQVIRAWSALANGGKMPTPHIIAEIDHPDGKIEKIAPEFKSVLKPDTATTITSMLVSAVKNGYSNKASVPGYRIAGKTGTSQIARTDGVGYERTDLPGSVITSFAGFAPAEDPRFVVLVKFDRPRFGSADNIWGENTAAPVFKELTEFLLDYYSVPPDPSLLNTK